MSDGKKEGNAMKIKLLFTHQQQCKDLKYQWRSDMMCGKGPRENKEMSSPAKARFEPEGES